MVSYTSWMLIWKTGKSYQVFQTCTDSDPFVFAFRLRRLKILRNRPGVFTALAKAVEIMFGKELRDLYNKCRLAGLRGSCKPDSILHEVREQLSTISRNSESKAASRMIALLADLEHGKVELPPDQDAGGDESAQSEVVAAESPTHKRKHSNKKLEKRSASTPDKAIESDGNASHCSADVKEPANETRATTTTPVGNNGVKKRKAGGHAKDHNAESPTKKKKEVLKPKPKSVVRRKPAANNRP